MKAPLIVSGIIFLLVALIHLVRLIHPFPVIINEYPVSQTVSIVALILFGLLAAWCFKSVK